jgi:catechol 2,3-dioxygenase-like lactoylglutathione lyase family enzyme
MWPRRIRPTHINHIALRVRDLERSAKFYCELFGLEVRPAVPPGDSVCVCAAPSASSLLSFGVALIQGLPRGADPIGMDHVSLEVAKAEDLEDIYAAATARGTPATDPRVYGGYYQTFVFDPDGYKIEVVSADLPSQPTTAHRDRPRSNVASKPSDTRPPQPANLPFGAHGHGGA